MKRAATLFITLALLSTNAVASSKLMTFLLSFDGQKSSCDVISVEKTYSDDEKVVRITLQDLAELGNPQVISGIELKKFKFIDQNIAQAERFFKYEGKRVKEVYTFKKDENGKFNSVSLKRYKRKLLRYAYSIGGIICRK